MASKKSNILMVFVFLASVILAACGPAATAAPVVPTKAPEVVPTEAPKITDTELNMLCTPQEQWCQGMKQEFEAKYGITVNYVRMSAGEAVARLQAEKDNPQFDIWWGGPIDSFVAAKGEGLLEAYDSPNYANLTDPVKMKDVDNRWACTSARWVLPPTPIG
jgi:iron(III) transport system substrate-binding protein